MSPSVEPFNEAKYKALMDGLEIVEIPFKELATIIDYRIESEYFSKKFIENEKLLINMPHKRFNQIATASNGRAYSSKAFSTDGEIYISKIGDVTNKREIDVWGKVSLEEFCLQKGALLKDTDILITLTGDPPDVGKVNMVFPNKRHCTWNQRVARIERLGNDYISNYALYAVLSSEVCRIQMERFAKGIRQRNLGNDCFAFVEIPILCSKLQQALDKLIQKHINLLNGAQEQYLKVEQLLFSSLSISDFTSFQKEVSVKLFSESCGLSGRMDAEYYQSKYTSYTDALRTTDTVQTLCNLNDKNFIPKENVEYEYIELANVGNTGNISNVEKILGKELPSRARRQVKTGQVIIASVEGSLQSCALITEEYNNALCSTGFYVLESDILNPETLLVLFKSKPIQALLKQRCSGTILTAITKDEFLSMPLPRIDVTLQKEIAIKIQESFAQRRESELLLNYAKRAVKIAIEQGEETAIDWLKDKGGEC